ncbi:redoxin domain-containing protein [Rufibacter ruber]|uniref:redoxin domain-containing protein n=1 Tax=Rufibacter ruber TaxID=1783499 RepID=UPI00082A7350|nr:redoxin domain-containing protein [Rufibacter ruber]
MKTKLLLLPVLFSGALASAQIPSGALTLKPAQPKAGQEIKLTYNPAGTNLANVSSVTALVYAYNDDKPNVQEVAMAKTKNGWEGNFKPAPEVDGAVVLFRHEETIDHNKGKGYPFYLYDAKKQPVAGAAFGLGAMRAEWGSFIELDRDPKQALELLEQEEARFPARKREVLPIKLYTLMAVYKGDEGKQKVKAELDALSKEPNLTVKDLSTLATYYGRVGEKEKAAAFADQVKAKEPKGEYVQSQRRMAYFMEKDPDKRKELAFAFAADFPAYEQLPSLLGSIAIDYAVEGKMQEFESLLQKYPSVGTSGTYNSAAWKLYESGENLPQAKALAQKGYQLAQKEVTQPTAKKDEFTPASDWKKSREYALGQIADTYGAILLKEGDKAGAAQYLAEAYTYTRGRSTSINDRYAEVLAASPDRARAQKTLEEIVASGNSTPKVKGYLKDLYTQAKGETGFDTYWAKVEAPAIEKLRADLKKKIISEKAPSFELLDLNGKPVSLASLKGKTVIVDFWATWCGPCVASFPGMQQAVNKFKDDDKVAFVFVNSWENGEDKKKSAGDFMAKKNYTFQVLLDDQNKMIEAYKVTGIPTKFVLDGNGNIRFKSVGYSGNNEKTVQEISMMVELLKPELLTSAK